MDIVVHRCLFLTFISNFFSHYGCVSENCTKAVIARRSSLSVPSGGSVSLSCDVRHCGADKWSGGWVRSEEGSHTIITASSRRVLSNITRTPSQTSLLVSFQNISQSESGSYMCEIRWPDGTNSLGHVTYVNVTYINVTEAVGSQRKVSHRILVCFGASLCFPLALVLACCLSDKPPQVPPRSYNTPNPLPEPQNLVVYAALAVGRPKQHNFSPKREPTQPTVYSSLQFS
ncbi:uncharacterized protein LOC115815575 [Chanos chanos]|uniref:Uncharacterized protein LOC115815575 n=1 Tax=Chanos chanos TaxID=29144 RepID=A0A6J2VQX6_CHACN|nr:uncharacterized protein LOC115815575 [Chanos chanos]